MGSVRALTAPSHHIGIATAKAKFQLQVRVLFRRSFASGQAPLPIMAGHKKFSVHRALVHGRQVPGSAPFRLLAGHMSIRAETPRSAGK